MSSLFGLKDNPELIEEYKYWHDNKNIWPEIPRGIKEAGILNMEIYLLDTTMFMIMDTVENFDLEKDMERLGKMDRQKEWEEFMARFQDVKMGSNEKWKLMERVFKLEE
ncbi:MAG: L-rhamnose mutarotase [Bacteroidales bacterium]